MNREPFDPRAYRDPRPSPGLIRALDPLNRRLLLPRLLKVREIDLPAADLGRLRAAIHPGVAAFLAPNHPEFLTDWMLDKELARQVSPLMAHWAAWEIVNRDRWTQAFLLQNNLIANVSGGGGKDYSVRWALQGHGVLLHPEGGATWHGDHVGPLAPGIVDMAWNTCRIVARMMAKTPVAIVPMVWKYRFIGDASAGLDREMALIERRLRLSTGRGLALEKRFEALQWSVLLRRRERFGFMGPVGKSPLPPHDFFEVQATFAKHLLETLEGPYGRLEGDPPRAYHALRRTIRERAGQDPAAARDALRRLREIERLGYFAREIYDRPTLTQEQIAESLKQMRSALIAPRGLEGLLDLVPVPAAPRAAHIRVLEPFQVQEAFAAGGDEAAAKAALLGALRERMQAALDALNAQIADTVERYRRPNPLHIGALAVPASAAGARLVLQAPGEPPP